MSIKEAEKEEDLVQIKAMAMTIWPETYYNVIPDEQVDFLLDKYFSIKNMNKYVKEGYKYFFINKDDVAKVGFFCYKESDDFVYLDKLYIKKEYRGNGLSKEVMNYIMDKTDKKIVLNVNINNTKAYKAYLASGFKVIEQQSIPLQDGMVNKDYVMVKEKAE